MSINIIASNRGKLNIKEIVIIPFVSFIIIGFFINFIVGLIIGLLNLLLYPIVRFSTWVFYKEVKLINGKLFVLNKFLSKSLNSKLIANNFDNNKLFVEEIVTGGKSKYILQYRAHKIIDLLITNDISLVKKYGSLSCCR